MDHLKKGEVKYLTPPPSIWTLRLSFYLQSRNLNVHLPLYRSKSLFYALLTSIPQYGH